MTNIRREVLSNLQKALEGSVKMFNEREEKCSDSMFTAAVAYLGIMFAFSDHINTVGNDCGWCIFASVGSLLMSLIMRLVDFALVRRMLRKYERLTKKMIKHVQDTRSDDQALCEDSIAVDLLCDEKEFVSSSLPIILQMMTLIAGLGFSAVALAVSLVR